MILFGGDFSACAIASSGLRRANSAPRAAPLPQLDCRDLESVLGREDERTRRAG
jgi:hypothetical protein